MKKALYLFALLGIAFTTYAQPKEISRDWMSFAQTIDVSFVKKEMKFRVIGSAKAVTEDSSAWSDIWATVVSKQGDKEGFDNNTDRRIKGGEYALLVEGTGIEKDTSYVIGPVAGFTPQIGTLVTMLNNLSQRVEYTVQMLDQEETDFLMDEKANSD